MPSFSDETIESWRHKRVHERAVSHDPADLGWLTVIDADIREETSRLDEARRQMAESKEVLRLLRGKRDAVVSAAARAK